MYMADEKIYNLPVMFDAFVPRLARRCRPQCRCDGLVDGLSLCGWEIHRGAGREEQVWALIRTSLTFVASSLSASSAEDVVALTRPSHVSWSTITKGSMSCRCQEHVDLRLRARRWNCQVVVNFSRIKCTSMLSEIGCTVSTRKRASRMHALGGPGTWKDRSPFRRRKCGKRGTTDPEGSEQVRRPLHRLLPRIPHRYMAQ